MSESQPPEDFGSPECLKKMWRLIAEHCLLLGEVVETLRITPNAHFPSSDLMFHAILDSGHSYMLLLENNKVRDCFTLARCIFETTINACFIAGNGQTTESQAVKHAIQKAHREKQRKFTFRHTPLNVGWPHGPVPPNQPMVVAALAEYTSKKGREITSWTQEAIEERIEAIEKWLGPEIGDRLRFALFSIYRDSSEIIHGTLYSVLSFAGIWNIPAHSRSKLTMEGYHRSLATTLSLQVAGCLNTAIRAACRLSGDDNNASVANDILRAVKEAPWAQGLKISPDGYPMRDPLKDTTVI